MSIDLKDSNQSGVVAASIANLAASVVDLSVKFQQLQQANAVHGFSDALTALGPDGKIGNSSLPAGSLLAALGALKTLDAAFKGIPEADMAALNNLATHPAARALRNFAL